MRGTAGKRALVLLAEEQAGEHVTLPGRSSDAARVCEHGGQLLPRLARVDWVPASPAETAVVLAQASVPRRFQYVPDPVSRPVAPALRFEACGVPVAGDRLETAAIQRVAGTLANDCSL